MAIEATESDIQVETLQEPPKQASQPRAMEPPKAEVNPLSGLTPPMSDSDVRAAIASAEANGLDPLAMKLGDLEVKKEPVKVEAPPTEAQPKLDVPEKFKKPNGEVDVEKLKTSTMQLDEATKAKEAKLQEQKSVEDYLKEYKETYKKFRATPNPEKVAAQAPPPVNPQVDPTSAEAMIQRDYAIDPIGTMLRIQELYLEKRLEPILEKEKDETVRDNIRKIAENDPRILNQTIFNAVNAKLAQDPDLWTLKNPHRAAWLEVKEEMRLGDYQNGSPAQPSRPASPILGGGTPPSTPSSTGTQQPSLGSLPSLDPRDKKQEAMGDELIRNYFARTR